MTIEPPTQRKGLLGPEWLAETIRLTAFSASRDRPNPLWSKFGNIEPSEVVSRPNEGILNETGPFGTGNLAVSQMLGRVDVIFTPIVSPPNPTEAVREPDLQHIGPAAAAYQLAMAKFPTVDSIFETANRIAFYLSFVRKVQSDDAASEILLEYEKLPLETGDSDIVWRVNRSLPANSFPGRINRLTTWSTARLVTHRFFVGQPFGPSATKPGISVPIVKVEVEANTAKSDLSDTDPFPKWRESLQEVLDASVSLFRMDVQ